ncbi:hypothetical protein CJ179_38430 [Rhodococcus sp. ACS1]|uniref:hypothetical protein n=1 Tax=Rhodococcus sp. ACS1 TaxID=2028570 RepID=UPI000BB13215|nr:hypothetical protein [Rhodococcus sp. ACS1]PBC38484.1 hypothetical protein CJ179_38430 [Rhodococcus sp. ACS1]
MPYPLRYMTVVGNLSALVADGADVGDVPDAMPITGKVEFRLITSDDYVLCPDATGGPTIKYVAPIIANIDVDGDISWQGLKSVKLFTPDAHTNPTSAAYNVRFTGLKYGTTPVTIEGFNFDAVPDATINLTSVARVPGTKPSPVTVGPRGRGVDSVRLVGNTVVFSDDSGTDYPAVPLGSLLDSVTIRQAIAYSVALSS